MKPPPLRDHRRLVNDLLDPAKSLLPYKFVKVLDALVVSKSAENQL